MGGTWFIQFNDYHVYYRISMLYDKENGYQQDKSWCVYIHTANALKRMQITILSELCHISRKSNFRILLSCAPGKMT